MFTKVTIETYFNTEKAQGRVFILAGLLCLATALVFLFLRESFYTGSAIPLLLLGSISATVGYAVYKRSDNDRQRNVYAFDMNPGELKTRELPRMQKVMRAFVSYRYTELFLLVTGLALYVYFIRDIRHDFWRGFGLSLAVLSLLLLLADFIAERRGKEYLRGMEAFLEGKGEK